MKSTPALLLLLLSLAAAPCVLAQTTVITEPAASPTPMLVQPVAGGTPMEVVPVQAATPAPVAVEMAPATTTTAPATLQPGQHLAEIVLTVSRGSVQAYFGRAAREETFGIGGLHISVKAPSTATVEKLASRDKDTNDYPSVTPGHPWHVTVPFDGPGRFVFNIVDWSDDPIVTSCVVTVDGEVVFSGHGSKDDFNDWPVRHYGEGVRKTGSREIAFIAHGAR